jgi:PAS domain S-box-containing protein
MSYLEAGGLFLALFVLCLTVFNRPSNGAATALLYAPLPLLLWAALRFNLRGATTASAMVTFIAIWGATHGHGPFAENSVKESAFQVQLFVTFMSLPLLFLGALTEERNKTRQTLQAREERISLAAETAHLGLWTIDFERERSWMNDKGRDLFGFGPDEPLSREVFLSRGHPEDRERVNQVIEHARIRSETFEIEFRLLREDGSTRWLISRGRYLSNSLGESTELLGVAIDVTGQVKASLELRAQQEELARLSRVTVMGELTASLAHELNQPLTAIASNAAAGKRFLNRGELDPSLFQELFEDVFLDARRAGAVIQGIRQFVRKGEELRVSLGLNEVIDDVLRLLRSNLLSRAATVETRLDRQLPVVWADPVHMQQVLINLVVNSLEAMEELPVERRRLIISTEGADESVRVAVRDFGIGLPAEDPDKIFAHFFSTKPNGMGMGLPIVRSIVEAHGGELRAENLGDGACISFFLPTRNGSSESPVI